MGAPAHSEELTGGSGISDAKFKGGGHEETRGWDQGSKRTCDHSGDFLGSCKCREQKQAWRVNEFNVTENSSRTRMKIRSLFEKIFGAGNQISGPRREWHRSGL